MGDELRHLVDEAAIKRVHVRYCRAVDRMDWDLLRSCYHPGAVDDHGSFRGGVEEFVGRLAELLPLLASTTHFIGNQLVEIDGDRAWMESYTRAYHRIPASAGAPAGDYVLNLRYVDRLERRGGEWRIVDRVVVHDSERTDPVAGGRDGVAEGWQVGARDRTDPSYRRASP
ncbi:nuclear transport factor 2 family protein [Pseudonocardia humida]|uniref:Nuclear transport factor 2 family protein n=1 Tax=Pseudonocardia humida TaxID=2800819 RepID=A0ABT0ZXR1_9PSEU|nr:nuclear transport factor 2 family protein [Pseudonocardia humida]MCO1655530.1 nuclear transport factor 2 family protein [Pseudonocardia humida]